MSVAQVLSNLLSTDNNVRKEAETLMEKAFTQNIQVVIHELLTIIQNPTSPISLQAMVQLRRVVRNENFVSVDMNIKTQLLDHLFTVYKVNDEKHFKNLSNIITPLIHMINQCSTSTEVGGATLAAKIFTFIDSADPRDQLWGLQILSDAFEFVESFLNENATASTSHIQKFLTNTNERILIVATQCASNLLVSCKNVRKTSMIASLIQSVCSKPMEQTIEVFSDMLIQNDKVIPETFILDFISAFISVSKNSKLDLTLRTSFIECAKEYIMNRQKACTKNGATVQFVRSMIELLYDCGVLEENVLEEVYPYGAHLDVDIEEVTFLESIMHTIDTLCVDIDIANTVCSYAVDIARNGTPNHLFASLYACMACCDHFEDAMDEKAETSMVEVIKLLKGCIVHADWRITITSLRALCICINGSSRYFTIEDHNFFMNAFNVLMGHPRPQIRAYAVRMTYDYGAIIDSSVLEGLAPELAKNVSIIFEQTTDDRVRSRCFTALSTICIKCPKALENERANLMRLATSFALNPGICQARAIEHVTRLAVSFGKDEFLKSPGLEVLKILPNLRMECTKSHAPVLEDSDDLREYVDDALACFIQMLGESFADVFECLVPVILFAMDQAAPFEVDSVQDDEDQGYQVVDRGTVDGKYLAVRNESIHDLQSLLDIAALAIQSIGVVAHARGGLAIENRLFDLAVYKYSEEVRLNAVLALAKCVAARFHYVNNPETASKISESDLATHRSQLTNLAVQIVQQTLTNLEESQKELNIEDATDEDDSYEIMSSLRGDAELAFRCLHIVLKSGIKNVLPADILQKLSELVMKEINAHIDRAVTLEQKKKVISDEDDMLAFEEEEGQEISTRNVINDVLTAIIESHPAEGIRVCGQSFSEIIKRCLEKKSEIFLSTAMCFASDWIEFADEYVAPEERLTPTLVHYFIQNGCLSNERGSVRQPAAFAIQKAFQKGFLQGEVADKALSGLGEAIKVGETRVKCKNKDQRHVEQSALDNAVAALFEAVLSLENGLIQPTATIRHENAKFLMEKVLEKLPLKVDEEENSVVLKKMLDLLSGPQGQKWFLDCGAEISRFVAFSMDYDLEEDLSKRVLDTFKMLMNDAEAKKRVIAGVSKCPERVRSKLEHYLK